MEDMMLVSLTFSWLMGKVTITSYGTKPKVQLVFFFCIITFLFTTMSNQTSFSTKKFEHKTFFYFPCQMAVGDNLTKQA